MTRQEAKLNGSKRYIPSLPCPKCGIQERYTCDKKCVGCNTNRCRTRNQKSNLRQKYGISVEFYNELLEKQGGKCAICGVLAADTRRNLCVDHDHETGAVRSLLCDKCNCALGLFNDDPQLIEKAGTYLKSFQ